VKVIKAPEKDVDRKTGVFLSGSITNQTKGWRAEIENALTSYDVYIYNPLRPDWDSSWERNVDDSKFYNQIAWELNALQAADIIFIYFDSDALAPITLLELGLYARSEKLIVCCPDGYWRKGNVEIVCERFRIPFFDDFEDAIEELKRSIEIMERRI